MKGRPTPPVPGPARGENCLLLDGGKKLRIPTVPPLPELVGLLTGTVLATFAAVRDRDLPVLLEFVRRMKLDHHLMTGYVKSLDEPARSSWHCLGARGMPLEELANAWTGRHEALALRQGYPPCCVSAFRTWNHLAPGRPDQDDLVPRTARRTRSGGPYPFLLNNLYNHHARLRGPRKGAGTEFERSGAFIRLFGENRFVSPVHPCRYDCPAALRLAAKNWQFYSGFMPLEAKRLEAGLRGAFLRLGKFELAQLPSPRESAGRVDYEPDGRFAAGLAAPARSLLERGDSLRVRGGEAEVLKGRRVLGRLGPRALLLRFA